MKVTIKTFLPVVVLVLLAVGIYVTGIGSQLQSTTFKTLPQSIITRLFYVNFSLSSGDETSNNLSSTSLLELDHTDSENNHDRPSVLSNNPASNIHNSKNVSIKTGPVTASVTISNSVTSPSRKIHFSKMRLNYSFAGSTFGTAPRNKIARFTSVITKNVSIITVPVRAAVTVSNSVTSTRRKIHFSNMHLNFSFAGSKFGTTPRNKIARSTSVITKNVSIKTVPVTASVTISNSVTSPSRTIHFSNTHLNYSFAGSTLGTTPRNKIARSTSVITKNSIPSTPARVTTKTSPTTTKKNNQTFYITAADMRTGRLGNQMFRYASLLGIARSNGRELIIAPGSQLQGVFKLTHVEDIPESRGWPLKRSSGLDLELMNLPKRNLRIWGFLQSPRYFSSVWDEVRLEFLFNDSVAFAAAKIVHSILPKHTGSLIVGVHARRGDFISIQKVGYAVPQKSYFMKAFQWMRSKFPGRNVTFLAASDDLGWVRANLEAKDLVVVPPASPGVHMAVLSSCEHMVISGGTFGWWSGWMAGGYVVYFKGYMAKWTTFGQNFVPSDYYPPLWVGLGN